MGSGNQSSAMQEIECALKLHKEKRYSEAEVSYKRLIEKGKEDPILYQNLGALLRGRGALSEAKSVLFDGHCLFPNHLGILRNLGNCSLDLGENTQSAIIHRKILRKNPRDIDAGLQLYRSLVNMGLKRLAYALILDLYVHAGIGESRKLIATLMESIVGIAVIDGRRISSYSVAFEALEKSLEGGPPGKPYYSAMILTQLWSQIGYTKKVKEWYQKAEARLRGVEDLSKVSDGEIQNWSIFSWNTSIYLLKKGELMLGWKLYEYGLQVPAKGKQKWQRSLVKRFTHTQIPIWNPETAPLGSTVLVMGEQGIGDTMMFSLLLPKLVKMGYKVCFVPGQRLTEIYRRSLKNINILDDKDIDFHTFDYQIPVGSLPRYLGKTLSDYGSVSGFLRADTTRSKLLRRKYQDEAQGNKLIGISWQGGGRIERIGIKSIKLNALLPLFYMEGVTFVSLQYGHAAPHVEKLNKKYKTAVICDESINALDNMDLWLSQVDAMDAVVSIANTTVHGSGGLNVPTMCLVSNQRDWRWVDPDIYSKSYWYKTIEPVYQEDSGDWTNAIQRAVEWVGSVNSRHK